MLINKKRLNNELLQDKDPNSLIPSNFKLELKIYPILIMGISVSIFIFKLSLLSRKMLHKKIIIRQICSMASTSVWYRAINRFWL